MSLDNVTSARLKEAVLKDLVKRIEDGDPLVTEDGPVIDKETGDIVRTPVPASIITAATAFLKVFPPQGELPQTGEVSEKLSTYSSKFPFPKR